MPIISVIVPVFKVESYLRRCVDSILAQTFTDFELILVDDGSPDNCPVICDEYATKDSRVKVIHKENGGLSSARNAGLNVAIGEYVLFVDSDDWIASETLEKTLDTVQRTDSDMVIFDFVEVYEDGTESYRIPNEFSHEETWTQNEFWQHYYDGFGVMCCISCNKLLKRALFDDLQYELRRVHEDEIIIYDLVKKTSRIVFLNEPLYLYFRRANSITGTKNVNGFVDVQYAFVRRASQFVLDGSRMLAAQTISKLIELYKQCGSSWTKQEKRILYNSMKNLRKIKLSTIWPFLTLKRKITVSLLYFSPSFFLYGATIVKKIRGK